MIREEKKVTKLAAVIMVMNQGCAAWQAGRLGWQVTVRSTSVSEWCGRQNGKVKSAASHSCDQLCGNEAEGNGGDYFFHKI